MGSGDLLVQVPAVEAQVSGSKCHGVTRGTGGMAEGGGEEEEDGEEESTGEEEEVSSSGSVHGGETVKGMEGRERRRRTEDLWCREFPF